MPCGTSSPCTFQCFAYYLDCTRVPPSTAPDVGTWLKDAALESSLMSIRDLDDFFCPHSTRTDDVIASDFDFPHPKRFLTKADRDSINTKLAHLTYRAVREYRQPSTRGQ